MHVKALEILTKTNSMTTNIKFLIEGEEEIGSPNLGKFVAANKELLKADVILISDSSMLSMENPSPVSYTHLRAHETPEHLVCRLLLEKKKKNTY